MSEQNFTDVITLLQSSLKKNGGSNGFCFDNQSKISSLTDLFAAFDRTNLIQELKKRAQTPDLTATQWVPLAAQIDYVSRSERDVRLRFRNRIQAFGFLGSSTALALASQTVMQKELGDIEDSTS